MTDSETNEIDPRHLRTPITEADFVIRMAVSVIHDNQFGAGNLQYVLGKLKEMEVKIQNGEIIDGDLLIEQSHKESKKPKSERSSENISLMLPFVYAVQAIKTYSPEDKDSVSLAWSLISDAKYHLGFMSAATLMTELAIEQEKRMTDNAIKLTKGLAENLDGMMATTDNILEIDRTLTKGINKGKASRKKGGDTTAKIKREAVALKHNKIRTEAERLLENGRAQHELAGVLSNVFNLSPTQIRTIIKKTKV